MQSSVYVSASKFEFSPMTAEQVKLVQITFEEVKPVSAAAAQLFYSRLFQLRPSLRQLFQADIQSQRQKLMQSLTVIVGSLEQPDRLAQAVQSMAQSHVRFHLQDEDYRVFGEALFWTIGQALGPSWTPSVREAWEAVYRLISSAMRAASSQAQANTAEAP
jgi:hemoglobin-like flavoprotein